MTAVLIFSSTVIGRLKQLWFDFSRHSDPPPSPARVRDIYPCDAAKAGQSQPPEGRDAALEQQCREMLASLGMHRHAGKVRVFWNPRLRSSAGFASYPAWKIELNPRLLEFDGQAPRTLRHELAHLVAYQRAGHGRIEPHGAEWRQACSDLGIPGEKAQHRLPLPRNFVKRNFAYGCPSCGIVVHRVRKFGRFAACRACCEAHNDGLHDPRFQFALLRRG